jgi:gamma-glutamyltranspeptidase / glutathione hydrolase
MPQNQDAAIAAAAVLGLLDPSMTGIGGDAFCLFYAAEDKKVHGLNGSGRASRHGSLDEVCEKLGLKSQEEKMYGAIPTGHGMSVTVPGATAAWVDVVERLGSGKIGMGEVLAPAIRLAEEGGVISEVAAYWVSVCFFLQSV